MVGGGDCMCDSSIEARKRKRDTNRFARRIRLAYAKKRNNAAITPTTTAREPVAYEIFCHGRSPK